MLEMCDIIYQGLRGPLNCTVNNKFPKIFVTFVRDQKKKKCHFKEKII